MKIMEHSIIDDGNPSYNALIGALRGKESFTKRISNKVKQLRFEGGLLPFESLHPVIYIGPSIMARSQEAQFEDLLTEEKLPDLEAISEEVGHFLYHQSQYKHNRLLSGSIMTEAMALIDWYQTLKRIVPETTGETIFDGSSQLAQAATRNLSEKISLRLTAPFVSLNPITSNYSKGPRIIRGYLEHLIKMDRSGVIQDDELKKFYLSDGEEKVQYLINLYQRYVNQGDEKFTESLTYLKNSAVHEAEFRNW